MATTAVSAKEAESSTAGGAADDSGLTGPAGASSPSHSWKGSLGPKLTSSPGNGTSPQRHGPSTWMCTVDESAKGGAACTR